MDAQVKISRWARGFEPWKEELFQRTSARPELSDDEVREVTEMLLSERAQKPALPAPRLRRPTGERKGPAPMALRTIAAVENVNALSESDALSFEPRGLNLIYGHNGAGKTGYSRILKHAGRTLRREKVLTNVRTASGRARPRATLGIEVGSQQEEIEVPLDAPAPALLARICVADEKAGERYLTGETEIDYAPESLSSLQRLAKGLERVAAELDERLAEAQPRELDLRPYAEGTTVRDLLEELTASTSDEDVIGLAVMSDDWERQRLQMRQAVGTIDGQQVDELRAFAEQIVADGESLLADLTEVEDRLSPEELDRAIVELRELDEARAAAAIAAERFDGEPISGAGSEPWRLLWEAAREFAAHQGQALPPEHDRGRCPLCMQELEAEAGARLARFEEFVEASVSVRLREAEAAVAARAQNLPAPAETRDWHTPTIESLGAENAGATKAVRAWLAEAEDLVRSLSAGEAVEPLSRKLPLASVTGWLEGRRAHLREIAKLQDPGVQRQLRGDLDELEARRELSLRREEVLEHLTALRRIQVLKAAKKRTGTGKVSNMVTSLSQDLIKANLQEALNRQLRALNFRGLEVETVTRTVRGTPMMALKFKTVEKVPLTDVLSQGEQRRLSLAMFLAEMEVLPRGNPIVLDDPVSSIDHEGRRHIARTLLRLAADRQLIVFTHEITFVMELQNMAALEHPEVPLHVQHVFRSGETVGHVGASLPWEGLSSKDRLAPLRDKLVALKRAGGNGDSGQYEALALDFCSYLRKAFERTVEDRVLGGVVKRGSASIQTQRLSSVNCSEEICALVDRGMRENSRWVHDAAAGEHAPPTVEELEAALGVFEELQEKLGAAEGARQAEAKRAKRQRASELKEAETARRGSKTA